MPATPAPESSFDHFEIDIDIGARALRIVGRLDSLTAPCVLVVANAFLAEFPGDLTLDLARVSVIDSALRAAILAIHELMDAVDAQLSLVNQSAAVKRMLLAGGVRIS